MIQICGRPKFVLSKGSSRRDVFLRIVFQDNKASEHDIQLAQVLHSHTGECKRLQGARELMENCFVTRVIPEAIPASTPQREHRVNLVLEAFWGRLIWVCLLLELLVYNGFLQLKKRVVGQLQFQPAETREFALLKRHEDDGESLVQLQTLLILSLKNMLCKLFC